MEINSVTEHPLIFEYKNWQNQIAIRKVHPIQVWYGRTEFHPTEQWLLKAIDLDKQVERDFAVCDIIRFISES